MRPSGKITAQSHSTTHKIWLPQPLTILSAVLIVLAFPPWDLTALIWVSLVPWFFALTRTRGLKDSFLQGVWLSFLMSIGGFYWVAHVLGEFGGVPWVVAIIGLILYSLWGQMQFLIYAPIFKFAEGRLKPTLLLSITLALFYSGLDWCLPKLFVDTLGHSLYRAVNLRQIADIGGPPLLTFLIYLVNDAAFVAIRKIRARGEPSLWPTLKQFAPQAITALVAVVLSYGYGVYRNRQISGLLAENTRGVQAAVIQANIGDFDKVAAKSGVRGAARAILEKFYELSGKAMTMTPKPELVVWPETSYPSTFRTPETAEELSRDQEVDSFVRHIGVPLLFGGYDRKDMHDFNAFFFLSPGSGSKIENAEGDLQVYRKNILLLFGEYIPGAEQFQFLKNAFPQVGNFGRGPGPEVFKVGGVKIGPMICYEALFPNYIIGAARKGSELILNITNDSWFGSSGEPVLHLALVTFRSIETRLPQLRATNTGISTLILPDGTMTVKTQMDQPEIMNVRVPLLPPIWTLMKAWGDWFASFAVGLGSILYLLQVYFRRPP